MVRKEDADFYRSFSRKELQGLCKKYRLPANRSASDMAELLASYFEKNKFNSISFGVEYGGGREISDTTYLIPSMQTGTPANATENVQKDGYKTNSVTVEECQPQTARLRETEHSAAGATRFQEPFNGFTVSSKFNHRLNNTNQTTNSAMDCPRRLGNSLLTSGSQRQKRYVNSGESPQENSSPGCSSSSHSPSFEFYVGSEEGINLCVDLNFNPLDWINKMRSEVCVSGSIRAKKPRTSNHKTDRPTESDKHFSKCQSASCLDAVQVNDCLVVEESSLTAIVKENREAASDQLCNGERYLASSTAERCSRIIDVSDRCNEDKRLNVLRPASAAPMQIVSCSESCTKNCCVVSLDSDSVNSPEKKLEMECAADAADDPTDPSMPTRLISKLSHGISENTLPEYPRKALNSSSTLKPLKSGSGFLEMSSPEAKVCNTYLSDSPCKTRESSDKLKMVDTKPNGYSNSTEFHPKSRSRLPSNEEQLQECGFRA